MSEPISFVVPLTWAADPWESPALTWLDAEGGSTTDPEAAVRFSFRVARTARDELKIERALDELNEGIGETVDLEIAIRDLSAHLTSAIEAQLWPPPDGRPVAKNAEEREAQQKLIDALYGTDTYQRDRLVLRRMTWLRDLQRVVASWPILILDPPAGWERLANRALDPGRADLIATAYLREMETVAKGK